MTTSGVLHFQRPDGRSVCGRALPGVRRPGRPPVRVTSEPANVTCPQCLRNPWLKALIASEGSGS